jgi:hypothetical protein
MTLPVPLRAKHTDLQVLLCGLAATVVYLLYGFDGQLHRDQAMYVYAGQRVAAGAAPYIDMFERTGPLAQLIPGIGVLAARAANVDDIIGIRVLFTLLAAASVSLAYLLGRDFFHSRLAGLASAAALLCFEGFIYFASNGPSEKTAMVLFLLAALIAMNRRSWIVTGVFVSLATLTWQPVFLPAIAGTVTAVLSGVSRGHRLFGRWPDRRGRFDSDHAHDWRVHRHRAPRDIAQRIPAGEPPLHESTVLPLEC